MSTPRLIDVAVEARVSMKTVSNVVNGTGSAKPETRARVQAAIDALGYRPNVTARRLATGLTGTISIAVSSVTVPYFADISNRLDQAARERNLRVVIEQTHGDRDNELAILDGRERGLVDGVIFHPVALGPADLADRQPGFPLVLLGEGPAPAAIDHVMIDNVGAAHAITAHLVERQCRRIAFLGLERHDLTPTTGQRFAGYKQALRAADIRLDRRLHLRVDKYSPDEGYRAVVDAIAKGITPDGILCRDDTLAAGALHALHDHGLSVPHDVAIAGWDDLFMSRHLWPPLTTIAPAKTEIARTALRLLAERVDGHSGPGRQEILPYQLIERQSTARAEGASTQRLTAGNRLTPQC